jgi:plasmid stabilization system protein ParE
MSQYILTQEAERDPNEIWDYIAAESIQSSDGVVREIRENLELLSSFPGMGHPRKDVRDKRYRFWACQSIHHRVFQRHQAITDRPNRRCFKRFSAAVHERFLSTRNRRGRQNRMVAVPNIAMHGSGTVIRKLVGSNAPAASGLKD